MSRISFQLLKVDLQGKLIILCKLQSCQTLRRFHMEQGYSISFVLNTFQKIHKFCKHCYFKQPFDETD